ncbi:MAG: hypothetical protein KGQ41_08855 [Alphaproteobacteria bacterium]|nr:hypothetical protein [Alphaproteobacteria bacterium]
MATRPELDGKYTVVTQSSYDGPLEKQSDGFTTIKDGKTTRVDGAGCEWHSTFEWVDDQTVKMTSVVDTSNANPDYLLIGADGKPTYSGQTYETTLKAKTENGFLVLSGLVVSGPSRVNITMRRVRD